MAKKKAAPDKRKPRSTDVNIEGFRYYLPVLIVVMVIATIILFSEFIFSDKMLHGSDMINAGIFFRSYYVDYVSSHGAVPAWNPYIFGGMPFVDAFHGDIFYPLSVLKFTGNIFRTLGYNFVLHIFLAGLFMYFTARQFRLSRVAATVSALSYMFAGFLVSLVAPGHDGKIFVTTLFPLTILFLDRAFERKPILNFTLLGLVIGVIILSPHPQLSYYSLWAIALYGAFKLIVLYKESGSVLTAAKPAILLAAAVTVGLFISAIQFYPGYVYTKKYSPRADTKRGYDWATSWSMNEEEAFSLIVPEFSGSNSGEGNYYWGKNHFKDNSEYAGIIPLFLAVIAVFFYRRKEAIFFGSLALFAFVYALGGTTPVFRLFYYLIPNVKSLRAPSTIMFIFLFCTSLLAGMGMHYLIEKGRELKARTRKRLLIYIFTIPSVLLLFAFLFNAAGEGMLSFYSSIFYSEAKTTMVGQNLTKWSLGVMNLPNVQSGLWVVFLLVGICAALLWLYISRKINAAVLLLIPLLIMVDGIRFNKRFIKTYDQTQQFTPSILTDYLKNQPGEFRVLNLCPNAVSQDYLPFFGIQVVTGYHGNQLRWYDDLLGGPSTRNMSNPNFVNLVNARYILAQSRMNIPTDYFGDKPLIIERDFGQLRLYRNDNALPRAFFMDNFEVIPDRKNIYPIILNPETDITKKVYLEKEPPIPVVPSPDTAADTMVASAEIVSYADDSVLIKYNTDRNSLLVLTDNYYRFWQAYVNGEYTEILRADGAFRAVPVTSGEGYILFKYDRSGNFPAKLVTILTLILVAIILAAYLAAYIKARRRVEAPA